MTTAEQNFSKLFKQLQAIVSWYDQQRELDVEEALVKAKQAAELITLCARRLTQLENEFVKIKAELDSAVPVIDRSSSDGAGKRQPSEVTDESQ